MVISKIIRLRMHIVKEYIKQRCWYQNVTNDVMFKNALYFGPNKCILGPRLYAQVLMLISLLLLKINVFKFSGNVHQSQLFHIN